jgi:hypothetical protein
MKRGGSRNRKDWSAHIYERDQENATHCGQGFLEPLKLKT